MVDELVELVRSVDRDCYLSSLFAPDAARPHLMALYAYAAELARIPRLVSEAQIGEIRLQWWRDTIEGIFDGAPQDHPVAVALASAVEAHHLPKPPLMAMAEARSFDLYADQMPDMTSLEGYLGETQSVRIQLAAIILDPALARGVAEAAGLAGVAYGLAQIVSLQPDTSPLIPKGESRETLVQQARKRLAEARTHIIPPQIMPAFLPVSLTETYLASPGRPPAAWKRQWRLWRAARKNCF